MKYLLFLFVLVATLSVKAQNVKITPRAAYYNFTIGTIKYPLGSVVMRVMPDTNQVAFDYAAGAADAAFPYAAKAVNIVSPRSYTKYINGLGDTAFISTKQLYNFYKQYMTVQ